MNRTLFAFLLLVASCGMAWLVVPGLFTIDESHYLSSVVSLRHGRLTLPGYEGVHPSRELYFFDPSGGPAEPVVPPATNLPPLYALLALPFSFLGLRGLFT